MDNLTHSLVGVSLSRLGLNRLTPDATPILLLAANAPDLDVVAWFGGPSTLLAFHRGITHSFACSPLLALVAVALVRIFSRRRDHWAGALFAAWIGVLSHLLLDLTNNYGTRVLKPFTDRWIEWDTTFVVDPYIWAALIFALFAPLLGRLLSSEMGTSRRSAYPSLVWPILAIGFVLLYDSGRAVLHARATAVLNSRLYRGDAPLRVAAFPTPLSPLQWEGLVETSDRYLLFHLNLVGGFDPDRGRVFYKNDPGPAVAALRKQRDFGRLMDFAQYPLWRVVNDEFNARYRLTDLRFGDPVAQTFTCSARLANPTTAIDEHCDFSFSGAFRKD